MIISFFQILHGKADARVVFNPAALIANLQNRKTGGVPIPAEPARLNKRSCGLQLQRRHMVVPRDRAS